MATILVAGLINLETTARVDGFPIAYTPVRYPFHGVHSTVSGVGYNVAKALAGLGHSVRLLSLLGRDPAGELARAALAADGLPAAEVLSNLAHTPQSVILYNGDGRRQINVDLKDIQERAYPAEAAAAALAECQAAVLCNINFARPLLAQARRLGRLVVTDVHALADLDDPYNRDYLAAADIVFMSDELLPGAPADWARRVLARYGNRIVVVGLGAHGALLAVAGWAEPAHVPAVRTRPVVNTIGAGDALLSAFVHAYLATGDPLAALRQAVVFASWKIGAPGAADGFLSADELDALFAQTSAHARGGGA
jgi:ribokinase